MVGYAEIVDGDWGVNRRRFCCCPDRVAEYKDPPLGYVALFPIATESLARYWEVYKENGWSHEGSETLTECLLRGEILRPTSLFCPC